jgi:hypothetical protein
MPNTPVPAAATGLPETSRRSALAGAVALIATGCLPCPAKAAQTATAEPEPIIKLIDAYYAGMQAMRNAAADLTNGESDALVDQTWCPPYDALCERTPAIRSRAGAVAALKFLQEERRDFLDSPAEDPLLNALLSYLEGATA